MTATHRHDEGHAQAGEYVLGTLSYAERRAFEARLEKDPALEQAVAGWEERFFPYNALTEPLAPSDLLWPRIERSLQASGASAAAPRGGIWNRIGLWRAAAGAGLAASLLLATL
ncbi:RNA polymerase subunit sigma-70, partial [Halomonas sp. 707D4]|nr:RNA polymerase subunit sigma-70 [Halomonas sp. 707D4]